MRNIVYTIGHSDHSPDEFLKLLKKHKINALIDVRSQPYSSYVKHFNKEILKNFLTKNKIDYYYGGNRMGGRPTGENFYVDGKIDYNKVRQSETYQQGMKVLEKLTKFKTIVIMCAEEDPSKCHRTSLIVPELLNKRYEVRHIRSDGSYENVQIPTAEIQLPKLKHRPTRGSAEI